jgi:hypothetical protein
MARNLVLTATAIALVVSVVGVWPDGGLKRTACAQGVGVVTVGFDMVIDDDGDTTPDNLCHNGGTDCTLGPIDGCIQVAEVLGDPDSLPEFYFDAVLKDLPAGESLLTVGYDIIFPQVSGAGVLATQDHIGGMGPGLIAGNSLENQLFSTLSDLSDAVPDLASPHPVNVFDTGDAEYNPPFTQGP